jgi:hypothetical protein
MPAVAQRPQRCLQLAPASDKHLVRGDRHLPTLLDQKLLLAVGCRHHGTPGPAADNRPTPLRPKPQPCQMPIAALAVLGRVQKLLPRSRHCVGQRVPARKVVVQGRCKRRRSHIMDRSVPAEHRWHAAVDQRLGQ